MRVYPPNRLILSLALYLVSSTLSTITLDYTTEKYLMDRTWLEPWGVVPESQKAAIKNELYAELTFRHPLFGEPLEPIGRSFANDDVLFVREEGNLVVVHLTWSGLGDSEYPSTEFFDTWAEFTSKKMDIDNLGY